MEKSKTILTKGCSNGERWSPVMILIFGSAGWKNNEVPFCSVVGFCFCVCHKDGEMGSSSFVHIRGEECEERAAMNDWSSSHPPSRFPPLTCSFHVCYVCICTNTLIHPGGHTHISGSYRVVFQSLLWHHPTDSLTCQLSLGAFERLWGTVWFIQVTCVNYVHYITATEEKKNTLCTDKWHDQMLKYKASSSPASGLDSLETDVRGSIWWCQMSVMHSLCGYVCVLLQDDQKRICVCLMCVVGGGGA